jgi:hypothetical protein
MSPEMYHWSSVPPPSSSIPQVASRLMRPALEPVLARTYVGSSLTALPLMDRKRQRESQEGDSCAALRDAAQGLHRVRWQAYRGTSLLRNSASLGPTIRTRPRALWLSYGGVLFLVSEVTLSLALRGGPVRFVRTRTALACQEDHLTSNRRARIQGS